jgi:prepilin-type N-terminal cleavage/methylation domain-containing protein
MKGRIMKIMKKSSAGFTLIEVIVSLVLMGIMGLVAAMGLVQGIKAYALTKTSSETVQQAEYALNRIKLEFMNMDTVTAASSESITFTTNKVFSRISEPPISYTIARDSVNNKINLTVTPPVGTASTNELLTGVGTGGSFLTYISNAGSAWGTANGFGGTLACTSSSLSYITINLIITRPDGGGNLTFTTSINPRNNECTDGPQATSGGQ